MEKLFDDQAKILEGQLRKLEQGRTSWMFGYRIHPITKKPQFHNGVDLPYAQGTPIHLPMDGTCQSRFFDSLNGNALKFFHPGSPETMTSYCHMFSVVEDIVEKKVYKAGTVIGFVGSTGASTGPHLHFVFRVKGKNGIFEPIDPLPELLRQVGISEIPHHDAG